MSFNIGTSTTISTTAASSVAKMDMALDDIIKTSRHSVKKTTPSNSNAASRATGQNKARRNAQLNSRRGISSNDKPTGMEIERQVNRQQRRTNATTTAASGGSRPNNTSGVPQGNAKSVGVGQQRGGGGRGRQSRATAPSESAIRAKARNAIIRAAAKNNGNNNNNNNNTTSVVTAPSQQAISAAAKAMKEMGFKCPKGMMMQISFVPKPEEEEEDRPLLLLLLLLLMVVLLVVVEVGGGGTTGPEEEDVVVVVDAVEEEDANLSNVSSIGSIIFIQDGGKLQPHSQ